MRYYISTNYTKEKQERLKRFLNIACNGLSISRFVTEAIDNEIEARLDSLPPEEKTSVLKMLSKIEKNREK